MTLDQRIWKNKNKLKIGVQVFYWICYMGAVAIILKAHGVHSVGEYFAWIAINMPIKLLLFYGYYYLFIPKWFPDSTLKFVGVSLLLLGIYPFIKVFIDDLLGIISLPTIVVSLENEDEEMTARAAYWIEVARRFATVFFTIFFAFVVRFVIDWFRNLRIRAQMEKEQLKSELALLRNQVNPHFLFNVLNNIDTLVYPHSKEASEAIVKLSAIMRYMLYESNTDWVSIQKEVEYLKAYIELQKMRLKKADAIKLDLDISHEVLIPPMLLIPFVENAFKHAGTGNEGPGIKIKLGTSDSDIVFEISNDIQSNGVEKDEVGGIGLQNVRRRLELIYSSDHKLEIDQDDQQFSVKLTIPNRSA